MTKPTEDERQRADTWADGFINRDAHSYAHGLAAMRDECDTLRSLAAGATTKMIEDVGRLAGERDELRPFAEIVAARKCDDKKRCAIENVRCLSCQARDVLGGTA